MGDEPTKVCVKLLKCESVLRYYIKIPLRLLIRFIIGICSLINWCIAGVIMRWFGIPISIYLLYLLFRIYPNSTHSTEPILLFHIVLIALSGAFGLMAWVDISDKEREILGSYKPNGDSED